MTGRRDTDAVRRTARARAEIVAIAGVVLCVALGGACGPVAPVQDSRTGRVARASAAMKKAQCKVPAKPTLRQAGSAAQERLRVGAFYSEGGRWPVDPGDPANPADDVSYSQKELQALASQFDLFTINFGFGGVWDGKTVDPWSPKFCPIDHAIDFASANGQVVRMHTLVWGQSVRSKNKTWTLCPCGRRTPEWLIPCSIQCANAATVRTFVDTGIAASMARVAAKKGPVFDWVVVNEAVHEKRTRAKLVNRRDGKRIPAIRYVDNAFFQAWGGVRNGETNGGDDYIVAAFQKARASGGGATLLYNDVRNEEAGRVRARYVLRLAKRLRKLGLLDAVGFQMHVRPEWVDGKYRRRMSRMIATYEKLGIPVRLTELDTNTSYFPPTRARCGKNPCCREPGDPPDPAKDASCRRAALARTFRRVARLCAAHEGCDGLSVWGVSDRDSWNGAIPSMPPPGADAAAANAALKVIQAEGKGAVLFDVFDDPKQGAIDGVGSAIVGQRCDGIAPTQDPPPAAVFPAPWTQCP